MRPSHHTKIEESNCSKKLCIKKYRQCNNKIYFHIAEKKYFIDIFNSKMFCINKYRQRKNKIYFHIAKKQQHYFISVHFLRKYYQRHGTVFPGQEITYILIPNRIFISCNFVGIIKTFHVVLGTSFPLLFLDNEGKKRCGYTES